MKSKLLFLPQLVGNMQSTFSETIKKSSDRPNIVLIMPLRNR